MEVKNERLSHNEEDEEEAAFLQLFGMWEEATHSQTTHRMGDSNPDLRTAWQTRKSPPYAALPVMMTDATDKPGDYPRPPDWSGWVKGELVTLPSSSVCVSWLCARC